MANANNYELCTQMSTKYSKSSSAAKMHKILFKNYNSFNSQKQQNSRCRQCRHLRSFTPFVTEFDLCARNGCFDDFLSRTHTHSAILDFV